MVVNRDLYNSQRVTVECADGVKRVLDGGVIVGAEKYSPSLNLAAGDMLLFEL